MIAVLAALAVGAAPFNVTLVAPTHTPKVNAKWNYSVRAVDLKGKPLHARITAQVVDPIGGVHPVEYGDTTKTVTAIPFTGTFRDFVRWPPESRGFKVTFRVIVASSGKTVRVTYWVKSH
jgi:hypothetical protein